MSYFEVATYMTEYVLMPAACGIAGWVASHWSELRRRKQSHKLHVPIVQRHEQDIQVHDLLVELRTRLGASRTYVTKFHNGDKFIDGDELIKESRTHVAVSAGATYSVDAYQNVLISTVSDEMDIVLQDGPSFTPVDKMPPGRFRWMCMEDGARAIARCGIKKNGMLVGFIGADFQTTDEPTNIQILCEYAGRINSLLEDM